MISALAGRSTEHSRSATLATKAPAGVSTAIPITKIVLITDRLAVRLAVTSYPPSVNNWLSSSIIGLKNTFIVGLYRL